jgi:lysophospholipase L1-like esterase
MARKLGDATENGKLAKRAAGACWLPEAGLQAMAGSSLSPASRLLPPTMLRLTLAFLTFLLAPFAFSAPEKWKDAIDKFTQADAAKPPAPGGVVFVGSSSIVKWTTLEKDFPGENIIKRGFGGSQLDDSVFYVDRIVVPYKPRVVVLYAGDNDLAGGKTPEKVFSDFKEFVAKIHAALPQTRIVYIGIKPCPSRWKNRENIERTNALIAAECAKDAKRLRFVDVWQPMLDAKGQPRPELFVADMLHMNPDGYKIWRPLVAAQLK